MSYLCCLFYCVEWCLVFLEQPGGCLIRCNNCLPYASTWILPQFFGEVRVTNLFSLLCCVMFYVLSVLFIFILCVVYPMLTVSLDCPLLITLQFSLT